MAMESVQAIIIRAVTENEFRDLFFEDPAEAIQGYELTQMETEWLKRLKRKEFDTFAPELRNSLINNNGIPLTYPVPS